MVEMTYFRAELLQLIVSWSDWELEVHRYGMMKNTLSVVPVMSEDELWMSQCEVVFFKTKLWKLSFFVVEILMSVQFRHFCRVPHTPNVGTKNFGLSCEDAQDKYDWRVWESSSV